MLFCPIILRHSLYNKLKLITIRKDDFYMHQSKNQQFVIEKTFELVTLIKTHITSIDVDDEETVYSYKIKQN